MWYNESELCPVVRAVSRCLCCVPLSELCPVVRAVSRCPSCVPLSELCPVVRTVSRCPNCVQLSVLCSSRCFFVCSLTVFKWLQAYTTLTFFPTCHPTVFRRPLLYDILSVNGCIIIRRLTFFMPVQEHAVQLFCHCCMFAWWPVSFQ